VKGLKLYHWLIGALIALFISLQSYTLSHATSFGDDHHEHEGIACLIMVIASDDDVALPLITPDYNLQTITTRDNYSFSEAPTPFSICHSRAPPPRGPPALLK